ncbi:hypothetical protein PHYSODRAFT_326886 [Phytophthora sojae]|uniref:Uncharacterized protein n=1 Tax=Phytophthora sojae (strain P6497) TaxID=1094619 RepID=G4Z1M2_PHYSP|nr:hypothetical protein PHYSODRAFT_326886 [Phytophthora sojae]EGZ25933.1 hypothetical protein PHYSODRAFT_326886 [Phytophthora sojae]|eukprot:XP_009521221.1 hypothetical protein PHYSODRAFT_326886 [Phytophthora sojae]
MDEEDSDNDFDFEQFLLAEQVRKYYYRGFYPVGIFVIWTLLRANCYDLSGCDRLGNPPIVYASKLRETALIVGCRNKRMRAIKLLLKRVIHERIDMVKLLLRYNASVTTDCYTAGSALDIAKRGTSERHAIILEELEKKLVTEREALEIEIAKEKGEDAIAEIEEYRRTRQAKEEAKAEAKTSNPIEQTTPKASKRSQQSRRRILAGESVGTRLPTLPVEQVAWKSLESSSDSSSDWIKSATGKWQTRQHLLESGASVVSTTATTMVEAFAPDQVTVRKLLTSEGKWQAFMRQHMPHAGAQAPAQLTVEDLD